MLIRLTADPGDWWEGAAERQRRWGLGHLNCIPQAIQTNCHSDFLAAVLDLPGSGSGSRNPAREAGWEC